ncbi:hypothetical protein V8E36_005223 [Tilletia maclaganii]
MVSHDPPLVMISFGGPGASRKDGERNIKSRKEFTISSSSEPYVEALNYASINAPSGISEFTLAGLTPTTLPHHRPPPPPPRVAQAPFALECTLELTHDWSNSQGEHTTSMIIGRVRTAHVRARGLFGPEQWAGGSGEDDAGESVWRVVVRAVDQWV